MIHSQVLAGAAHYSWPDGTTAEVLDFDSRRVPFEVSKIDEEDPAKSIACAECGSDQFSVAVGSYFTAIKCPNCGWELCIHQG